MVSRRLLGIVIPAIALLPACSGAPAVDADSPTTPSLDTNAQSVADPSVTETDDRFAELRVDAMTAEASVQDPQGPTQRDEERRRAAVDQYVAAANRSLELRLFQDALRDAARALELDRTNAEARRILRTVTELLGDDQTSITVSQIEDPVVVLRIREERTQFRATQLLEEGQALLEQGRPEGAVERFQTAVIILQADPLAVAGSDLQRRAQLMLDNARAALAQSLQNQESELRQQAALDLERATELERRRRRQRIEALLAEANASFQVGNYDSAIKRLDEVLNLDPDNGNAQGLRDLAGRSRHTQRRDRLREEWKNEWAATFDGLQHDMLPQTEIIKFDDLDHWREVSRRGPLKFTSNEAVDSPEERAILQRLDETVVEHRFASATIDDWIAYYRRVADVNFVKTPSLEDLDETATTLENFNLPPRSVRSALDVISRQTGIKWRVRDGVVELLSSDAPVGKVYTVPYEVRDIVLGVRSKPGPDLKLKTGSEPEPFFPDDETPPTVVDDGFLIDLIQQGIAPETWDEIGSINYSQGVLTARNTREVHQQIDELLSDLRRAVGIQVDIESRFLSVADNFLEDVGVDFRGLGDQSAQGLPGRGLANNPNAGFDDFGPPATINVANPAGPGTGTEPGLFFNDGGDGAYLTRTENLFDEALGGNSNLDNGGGLALQYAFLDDVEIEVVLRAVSKQERSEEITAPRLLVYNNTRANLSAVRQTSYIKDFDVEIAQAAAIANPVVDVVRDGVVLDVKPVVSADRRFITMELRPSVLTLQLPIPTFTTTLGTGQPVSIQIPTVTLQRVRTTVTMPDGGTLLLGGMKMAQRTHQKSGVPILKDIPILSFFFSRTGTFVQNEKIIILVRATIVLNNEFYPTPPSDGFEDVLLSSR